MGRFFRLPRFTWPILPLAPAIVIVVGITTAVIIALLGISQLQRTSDEAASLRAAALSATIAARLGTTAAGDESEVVGRAARRSAAEILLVQKDGQIVVNESFGAPSREEVTRYLGAGKGETRTALGRVRWAAIQLSSGNGRSVITFVAAPTPPPGSIGLFNAVAALTGLLLGIAVAVTFSYARAAQEDVDYVRQRIVDMARPLADPAGEPVPIRSLDQVGVLTAAFNLLVARFAAAERSYRADLRQAKEGDRERSAFLAGLSHELRTPLNAILGFTHVLESEVDGPLSAEAIEHLRIVTQSGEHLKTLIDDVLDLSALETGQLRLSRRPVDLRALADQVVRDTGAGISPEDAAAIFEAYRQGGDHRSRRGGAGLGLSIAQRLVGMHGGTIAVESRLGAGSTFTVCLPRVDEDAPELVSRPDYGRPDSISRPDLVSWPEFTPRPDLVSNPDFVIPSDPPPPMPKRRA